MNDSLDATFGGYECSFVEEPAQSLLCLICARALREPELTDCCGHHYCASCLRRWLESASSCPLCRKQGFRTLRDKKTERDVHELKVGPWNEMSCCNLGNRLATCRYSEL